MLLALDSATRRAGLALYDGEVVRAEATWSAAGVYHTEWLAPAIRHALERINASASDLSAVAVTVGPGSFTGLRVALSLAKGIAAAQGLPIIGLSSLDVTASPHVGGAPVLATLQAGRGRHAYAFYEAGSTPAALLATDPTIGEIQEIVEAVEREEPSQPLRVAGEMTPAERRYLIDALGKRVDLLSPALAMRRPAVLAELGWHRLKHGQADDLHTLEPLYLHLPTSGRR